MQKRTNTGNKLTELIFRIILPVLLAAILFGSGGLPSTARRLLFVSTALTFPAETAAIIKRDNETTTPSKEILVSENTVAAGNSDAAEVSSIKSPIPSDILKLVADAEKKYASSSKDGVIEEADYSGKNATSVYDGIYVRNTTKNHSVDIEKYLSKQVWANISKDEPSVLIYHTHTTETYELLDRGFYTNERSSRSENAGENMVRIGEEICKILEQNGYKTIHDKNIYDEQLSGAYDRSRAAVSQIIKDNPSIQVVIDIHRDSIYQKDGTRIKPVTTINGKKTAQIMIISGCEDGNVTDFPNWEKNLTFALKMQQKLSKDNPTLMRPLMFCSRKYNLDLMPCAMYVEFGSDANTLTEAVLAAQLFAQSLSEMLKEYEA
ncbi:MAG: stage II sporulation protein P [Oscillospiraceae bacterium]|nr:stage II sporulation protein P [Oscillospiraceae bacterium]